MLNVICSFQTFSSGVQVIVDDSDVVPLSACNLSQLGAFGKLCKLILYTLLKLIGANAEQTQAKQSPAGPHSKALPSPAGNH